MKKNADSEEILRSVQKPGRYIGEEWNIKKKDPEKVKAKVALIFPDTYEVGMSYLGHKILYHDLNQQPWILAERVYAPWVDFESRLREKRIPLYSLENKIPLHEFDIIGISLLYELNYSNILTILDLGKIPLLSEQRDLRDPLIIAGGPAAANPEPISDFFDMFFIGDGEKAFIEIIDRYLSEKKKSRSRKAILKSLVQIKGIYVPAFYQSYLPSGSKIFAEKPDGEVPAKIKKNVIRSFEKEPIRSDKIVPNIKTIFDRISIETSRGCAQNCRFCQARSIYFPLRNKNPGMVVEEVLHSLNSTGYEEASLSALSVGDYPCLDKMVVWLMNEFDEEKISLSLSALRPKFLTEKVAESIIKVKKTGFTIVPEAGTDRLRRVINKKLKEDEIFDAVSSAFSKGWRKLKMYFMVGLPTEKKEDLEGIIKLVEEIISLGYKILKRPPQINLSVSSFIPKPHTPFQWIRMNSMKELKEKHHFIRKRLKKYGFVWFKDHSVESSVLEGIFSRGDKRLNSVLYRAWRNGVRFDGWSDLFDFSIWEKAFEKEGLDYKIYLSSLPQKEVLPWDHIDVGIRKSYYRQELVKAFKETWSLNCEDQDCKKCRGCSFPGFVNKVDSSDMPSESLSKYRFGKKSNQNIRYRLFYEKIGPAKYLSHIDLSQILQRGFRRAGVQVHHSQGFHPKMQISFPPALALGMQGREEVLEFRSKYLFDPQKFISHVNSYLPQGVKAIQIDKVDSNSPSLTKDIASLVYSLDLKHPDVKAALKKQTGLKRMSAEEALRFVKTSLNKESINTLHKVYLDEKENKLLLDFMFSPNKAVRLKPIIKKILELEYSHFLIAREKINFKSS
ncbi:MAG: TIGR03960 family B12-binding radical SAM protein [Acidobacteriota bacterium]